MKHYRAENKSQLLFIITIITVIGFRIALGEDISKTISSTIDSKDSCFFSIIDTIETRCEKKVFRSNVLSIHTLFPKMVDFNQTTFVNSVIFNHPHFNDLTDFTKAFFNKTVTFSGAIFNEDVFFEGVKFKDNVQIQKTTFAKQSYFSQSRFYKAAIFHKCQYNGPANFQEVTFDSSLAVTYSCLKDSVCFKMIDVQYNADFSLDSFCNISEFNNAVFHGKVDFLGTKFLQNVSFEGTHFNHKVNFKDTKFDRYLDFKDAGFDNSALFTSAIFNGNVYFGGSIIKGKILFTAAKILNKLDFRQASFSDSGSVDFSQAFICDTILAGNVYASQSQRFDLSKAKLLSKGNISDSILNFYKKTNGAKIILYGPVDLKIQEEKLRFIGLFDSLGYFQKKEIISKLKNSVMKEENDKNVLSQLNYIFDHSTMYQKPYEQFERYPIYHPVSIWRTFYFHAMRLGYKPFYLLFWAGLIIIIGFIILFSSNKTPINKIVYKELETPSNKLELMIVSGINCFYFSILTFFSFKFNPNILSSFSKLGKIVILSEWCLGLLMYGLFFFGSKSGQIFSFLKSFF